MIDTFEIFNDADLPDSTFRLRSYIMKDRHHSLGEAIRIVQQNAAREIAMKIVEQPKLFKVTPVESMPDTASVECELVILTREELRAELLKYFRKGAESAYFPPAYMVQT